MTEYRVPAGVDPKRWKLGNLAVDYRYPGIGGANVGEAVVCAPGIAAWDVFLEAATDEQITRALAALRPFAGRVAG
jgi:hypothetical protein